MSYHIRVINSAEEISPFVLKYKGVTIKKTLQERQNGIIIIKRKLSGLTFKGVRSPL